MNCFCVNKYKKIRFVQNVDSSKSKCESGENSTDEYNN